MNYNLEMEKVINKIKEKDAKVVCIQLPEGLKPKALDIADEIERDTEAKVVIWGGSTFGSCDVPKLPIDLLIQWGHTEWK